MVVDEGDAKRLAPDSNREAYSEFRKTFHLNLFPEDFALYSP